MKQPDDLIFDLKSRVPVSETGADRGPAERWQHDPGVIEGDRRYRSQHARVLGHVERLYTNQYLTLREWKAAQRYRDDFDRAGLGPRYSLSQTERIDRSPSDLPSLSEAAQRRLNKLAKHTGIVGERILWYMVGCDMSAQEVAQRLANVSIMNRHHVMGGLKVTLGGVADFYHLEKEQ